MRSEAFGTAQRGAQKARSSSTSRPEAAAALTAVSRRRKPSTGYVFESEASNGAAGFFVAVGLGARPDQLAVSRTSLAPSAAIWSVYCWTWAGARLSSSASSCTTTGSWWPGPTAVANSNAASEHVNASMAFPPACLPRSQ